MKDGKDLKATLGVYRICLCDECRFQYCMRSGHNQGKPVKHNRKMDFSHTGYSNKQNEPRKTEFSKYCAKSKATIQYCR